MRRDIYKGGLGLLLLFLLLMLVGRLDVHAGRLRPQPPPYSIVVMPCQDPGMVLELRTDSWGPAPGAPGCMRLHDTTGFQARCVDPTGRRLPSDGVSARPAMPGETAETLCAT